MGCGRDHEVTGHGERSERSDHGVDYDSVGSGFGVPWPALRLRFGLWARFARFRLQATSSTCFYEFVNWRGRYMGLYVIIGVRRPYLTTQAYKIGFTNSYIESW